MSEQSWTLSDGHLGYEIMVNGQVIGRAFKTTQAKTEPEDRVTLDGEANGRLMAAAPELLVVAEIIAKWGRGGHGKIKADALLYDATHSAMMAIRKAKQGGE